MTAPTHFIFSVVSCFLLGVSKPLHLVIVGLGSLIPDIDTPKSSIGKLFFPISKLISGRYSHRTITHSILFYAVFLLFKFEMIQLLAFGAITHLVLDMFNTSGIKFFYPLSNKTFVMAGRNIRIRSGSRNEFILMICLGILVFSQVKLNKAGGLRGLLKKKIASYDQAFQDYQKAGLQVCFLNGELRYNSGRIEIGQFMIISSVRKSLFILDKDKNMIEIPREAQFLKATTVIKVSEQWKTIRLSEPMELKSGVAYYRTTKNIVRSLKGGIVAGEVLYLDDNIELGTFDY